MELNFENLGELLEWLLEGVPLSSTKTAEGKEKVRPEAPKTTAKTANLGSIYNNSKPSKEVKEKDETAVMDVLKDLSANFKSFYEAVNKKFTEQDNKLAAAFKQMSAINENVDRLAESLSSAEAGVDITSELLGDLRACQETESEEDASCPEEEVENEVEPDCIDVTSLIKLIKDFRARYRAESEELSEKIRTASVPKGYNDLSARVLNELSGKIRACDEILEAVGYY